MPDGNKEVAQDIFSAMIAATRGDDKAAGDLLRGAFGRITSQFMAPFVAAGARAPGATVERVARAEQGEVEAESPEEG